MDPRWRENTSEAQQMANIIKYRRDILYYYMKLSSGSETFVRREEDALGVGLDLFTSGRSSGEDLGDRGTWVLAA